MKPTLQDASNKPKESPHPDSSVKESSFEINNFSVNEELEAEDEARAIYQKAVDDAFYIQDQLIESKLLFQKFVSDYRFNGGILPADESLWDDIKSYSERQNLLDSISRKLCGGVITPSGSARATNKRISIREFVSKGTKAINEKAVKQLTAQPIQAP